MHVLSLPGSTGKPAEPAMLREELRFMGNARRPVRARTADGARPGVNL